MTFLPLAKRGYPESEYGLRDVTPLTQGYKYARAMESLLGSTLMWTSTFMIQNLAVTELIIVPVIAGMIRSWLPKTSEPPKPMS